MPNDHHSPFQTEDVRQSQDDEPEDEVLEDEEEAQDEAEEETASTAADGGGVDPVAMARNPVRGTSDNNKVDASLSQWEKDVRMDAAVNNGVVPPKSSGRSMNPSVRLNEPPKPMPAPGDTESELNGLISECRYLLHEVAFNSARLTYDPDDRIRFLSAAEGLARTAAAVGDTVSRLRAAGQPPEPESFHQHITVEHLQKRGGRGKSRKSAKQ